MSKVVERCPSCGVEHDHPVYECEACGSAVRLWCRTHSREIGWLEGDVCPRCPPTAPRPRLAPPPPPPAVTSAPAATQSNDAAPRPYLRFDRKPLPVESTASATAAAPPPSPAPESPPPAIVAAPPAAVPAEPEPSAAPAKPRQRRGMGVRLFESALTVMQTGIVGVLLGVPVGGVWGYFAGAEVPLEAAIGGAKGGMAGLALGVLIAIATFHRTGHPPEK
jgi:hypothetical protein